MNQRIQKKHRKIALLKLSRLAGVSVISKREIKRKQLWDTKRINDDFNDWFVNEFKPPKE